MSQWAWKWVQRAQSNPDAVPAPSSTGRGRQRRWLWILDPRAGDGRPNYRKLALPPRECEALAWNPIQPGLPIQASNLVVPPDGLGPIIATDDDPENIQLPPPEPPTPPLSLTQFSEGSSTVDAPALSLLWFDAAGQLLLGSI